MADMTPTQAMSHAPSTTARAALITDITALSDEIDTTQAASDSGTAQVYTAEISGTPTGGTYDLILASSDFETQTITLAYNAADTAIQAAIRALTGRGLSNTTVSASGSTPDFTHTITFKGTRADITLTKDEGGLTGGTSPDVTITETSSYAALPFLSAKAAVQMKSELIDWAERLASNMRA